MQEQRKRHLSVVRKLTPEKISAEIERMKMEVDSLEEELHFAQVATMHSVPGPSDAECEKMRSRLSELQEILTRHKEISS